MSFLSGYRTTSGFQSVHGSEKLKPLSKDAALERMKKEAPKVKKYRQLSDKVLDGKTNKIYDEEYLDCTTDLLDWNFDLYTVWNYRRDILVNYKFQHLNDDDNYDDEVHRILLDELQYSLNKLKRSPKSYWIWNHRIWCLKLDKKSDWKLELMLVEKFFQADSRNFHAWQYRRFIIEFMKNDKNVKIRDDILDFNEFKFTTTMINKDISNYSAWHNRTKLLENLFTKSPIIDKEIKENDADLKEYLEYFNLKSKSKFLMKELSLFKTAMYTDPDDSSVWIYMKWLFSEFFLNDLTRIESIKFINNTYNDVEELGALEEEDNGKENKWCLISKLYLLKQLYKVQKNEGEEINKFKVEKMPILKNLLEKLELLDPMRFERYKAFNIDF